MAYLADLTRPANQPLTFTLSPVVEGVPWDLIRFSSAPILRYPDTTKPFTVEINASEVGATIFFNPIPAQIISFTPSASLPEADPTH